MYLSSTDLPTFALLRMGIVPFIRGQNKTRENSPSRVSKWIKTWVFSRLPPRQACLGSRPRHPTRNGSQVRRNSFEFLLRRHALACSRPSFRDESHTRLDSCHTSSDSNPLLTEPSSKHLVECCCLAITCQHSSQLAFPFNIFSSAQVL